MDAGAAGRAGAIPAGTGTAAPGKAPEAQLEPGGKAPDSVVSSVPERIGVVIHYFARVGACVISVERGELRVGDTVHVRGHTTDFYQRVERLERDHETVEVARGGEEVAVQIDQRVRAHDEVHRLEH